ncbi:hypothetical protein PSN45_001650 [Yamadazyma tenuis]|uniref:Uncharacterized protein n=1 Tax=Candida tenuis (strain ATCC 10573 / BCRC 21748 / CBS 615 / JCM 9827 / NBRC 10315 / NRRL Y-1498 / VKM Y-70) TaxID=590646 RepID=G3BES8_CANTC|nr:uncharacterized protein CANTEDRAFT_99966 [Yamadazyma tenuis ATCC 10573]EGV60583.1 hypothetical protein CANTEDRAFT_99966 [Yamadazyma tenuis ATCC 10573]WEJ94170.1 hypothetical protein PSN45_001650 [Yamadazyma tenuis]
MLVPPDNFGLVEPGLYRCSKLDSDNFPFLETLNLKSILLLDAENPPRPLKTFISNNNIDLVSLGGLKVSNHNHTGNNNRNVTNRESNYNENSLPDGGSGTHSNSSSASNSRNGSRSGSETTSPVILSQGTFPKETNLQMINLNVASKKNDQWMLIEKNLIKKAFEILLNTTKYNLLIVDSTSTLVSILRKIQKWNFNSIVNEFRIYNGQSAKSNYYAENFLELIDIELVPFEIDQLNQFLKMQQEQLQKTDDLISKSPELARSGSFNHSGSFSFRDDENLWDGDTKELIDDDDIDDDLLSASPQIPVNLLKIVEKKRNNSIELSDDDKSVTPGTSPRHIASNANCSPMSTDALTTAAKHYWDKRKPSLDAKITRPIHNSMFRNSYSNSGFPSPMSARSSFENINSPHLRRASRGERKSIKMEDINDLEEKRLRGKYEFKYYKNMNKYNVNFDNVGYIKLRLPPSNKLPDWFIRGRDFWEESYIKFRS